ncbi:3062_t:CDS:1, partial [Gigaspora margarita]
LGVLFWELSSGVAPFKAFKDRVIRMTIHLIRGNRETPINGTPVDFKNLNHTAWGGDPDSRLDIREICKKFDHIQIEQVLYYFLLKFLKKCNRLISQVVNYNKLLNNFPNCQM